MSTLISSEATKLTFGKHKGKTITQVLQDDPGWLVWADKNVEFFKLDLRLCEMAKVLAKGAPRKFKANTRIPGTFPELDGGYSDAIDNLHDDCPF